MSGSRQVWIDASAGVAGDMLLGALLDAGASLDAVRRAIAAVVPDSVDLTATGVTRAGLSATKADVALTVDDPPHRTWRTVRDMLTRADLIDRVRRDALAVFDRLARAEAQVHAVDPEDIHFHEVGALDSIADVVGVCAALADLQVERVTAGPVAVGSGRVRAAHGEIPVPVPAVARLAVGWAVTGGGDGELATPTGMALIAALATPAATLPSMVVRGLGAGAGTRDFPNRANVTRVILGDLDQPGDGTTAVVLEANVDDLDPRLWPGVLAALLAAGASDAWLVPIVMKKGRPAHTLTVLSRPPLVDVLRDVVLRETTTFGVRSHEVHKHAVDRCFANVCVDGTAIAIKLAGHGGRITQATPEFDDVAAAARSLQMPVRVVLDRARAAAADAGLVDGARLPE